MRVGDDSHDGEKYWENNVDSKDYDVGDDSGDDEPDDVECYDRYEDSDTMMLMMKVVMILIILIIVI